jgi:hypothetical protein
MFRNDYIILFAVLSNSKMYNGSHLLLRINTNTGFIRRNCFISIVLKTIAFVV